MCATRLAEYTASSQPPPSASAMDGSHHRHLGVADAQHQVLQFLLDAFHCIRAAHGKGGHGGFQVGAQR